MKKVVKSRLKKIKPKRPVGRPSKYTPAHAKDLLEFFNRPLTKIIEVDKVTKEGVHYTVDEEIANDIPWLIDWTIKHNLGVNTPETWANKYPEFSCSYNRIKKLQARFLSTNAMRGRLNAYMTVMTLKNVAGWRDKQEDLDAKEKHTHLTFIQNIIHKMETKFAIEDKANTRAITKPDELANPQKDI